MSVAFTKEDSAETASEMLLPDRPVSPHPNLVTEAGVNTPPAKAGGFRLRLKAGLVRPLADSDGGCASSYLEIIVRFGRCLVLDIFGPYLIGNVSAAGDPISSAP